MTNWQIHVGRGWKDSVGRGVEIAYKEHEDKNDDTGVLHVFADAHLTGFQGLAKLLFYKQSSVMDGVGGGMHAIASFTELLLRPEVDEVSLIFVNFNPRMPEGSPRPEPIIGRPAIDIAQGLCWFSRSVAESIQPSGFVTWWSCCEWAMILASRVSDSS